MVLSFVPFFAATLSNVVHILLYHAPISTFAIQSIFETTSNEAREFAASAREGGFSVILAFAGMAAHLAGAMAANTTLPVIGVPCSGTKLDGMDALLSTVQMPSGIPVATVAVDGGKNAALLAVQIMAVSDAELAQKLDEARARERDAVLRADEEVRALYQ